MTATAVETTPAADLTAERLRVAQDALKAIDLRTLRGQARDLVKDARADVAAALTSIRS